jgi:2-amino-4-hydroxy-6-hydroxymethyldihydropteridine diphosphokinase
MARCLIGCGSNLGRRREQLDLALDLIRFMPGVELVAVSRYVETRPVGGPPGQGCYLNGACLLETDLEPHDLLGALMAVEHTLERRRDERWGERTVDLDILLYEDLVLDTPDLTLPHPRMATRRFVLEPSVEIAPELPYPPGACTVRDLLDNISVPHPLIAVVGVPGSGAPEVANAVADATLARLVRAALPMPVSTREALGDETQPDHQRWLATAAAWQKPLAVEHWHDDPHGTVTDYWLDAIPVVASARLSPTSLPRFQTEFDRIARAAVPPHVAILLEVSKSELAERLAFRRREAGRHSDVFADLPGGAAVATHDAHTIDAEAESLFQLQKRLERRLRCPASRCPRAPKAVITIAADDLAAATEEATAAVEAMV